MGGIQQCCFEEKKNHRLIRLTNNSKIIAKTQRKKNLINNYNKNKKRLLNEKNEDKENNSSDILQTGDSTEENVMPKKKENENKINKNKYKNEIDDEKSNHTFNKIKRNEKNKSSSVDNPLKRKNSCDNIHNIDGYGIKKKKTNIYQKKSFIKGDAIGEGRFGKVFSGLCISNGEIITIKYYKNLTDIQKERIVNNLVTLYRLNHKNIIKAISLSDGSIYDENGELRIVYESLKLKNVEEFIKIYGTLNENIIQMYVKQLLEGLKYLHENKIYHKNLKPTNILVDNDGTIKISDCLIDSLILGNARDIYNFFLKSDIIEYYLPPFFIKAITLNKEEQNNNKNSNNLDKQNAQKNANIFDDWISYDLWYLGCLIIEVSSRKKPWSHYNFKNVNEFFKFLNDTHLIPTMPQKLSNQCQELIKILFDYSLTKNPNIYETIFNLDFFKLSPNNFTYNNSNKIANNNDSKNILNDSQTHFTQSEDSNISMSNNINSESGMQLGQILAKNKVVNILNNDNNASFSVSYTIEDNTSLSQSLNKLAQSQNKLNQSSLSKNKNLNLDKIRNIMPEVKEAPIEQSPDPIKDEGENNFVFSKKL